MGWMWDTGHMWGLWGVWGWLLMPLMMTLVWLPLLLVVAWAARALFGTSVTAGGPSAPPSAPEPDARELARRAYARGELSRERFVEVIEDLDRTERGTR